MLHSFQNLHCVNPFWRLEVHQGGGIYVCCPDWLPTQVGNIMDISLLEALHSAKLKEIQKTVENGSYAFCDAKVCPYLSRYAESGEDELPVVDRRQEKKFQRILKETEKKVLINLCYDVSCNLSCPSCRNDTVIFSKTNAPKYLLDLHHKTLESIKELQREGYAIELGVTGSGDAFASPLYSQMLLDLESSPNLRLDLQTNGVLMDAAHFSPAMFEMVHRIHLSIDAFTEGTYRKVRRGGNFERVKENLRWLDSAIAARKFPHFEFLKVNFIVQKENFREIPAFSNWMKEFPTVNMLWFHLIADWGHLEKSKFEEFAIWKPTHPEHQEFLQVIRDPSLRRETVNLGNLSSYL